MSEGELSEADETAAENTYRWMDVFEAFQECASVNEWECEIVNQSLLTIVMPISLLKQEFMVRVHLVEEDHQVLVTIAHPLVRAPKHVLDFYKQLNVSSGLVRTGKIYYHAASQMVLWRAQLILADAPGITLTQVAYLLGSGQMEFGAHLPKLLEAGGYQSSASLLLTIDTPVVGSA